MLLGENIPHQKVDNVEIDAFLENIIEAWIRAFDSGIFDEETEVGLLLEGSSKS